MFQGKFLQAFVEMEDIGSAIIAKENLENSIIPSVNITILYIEQKDYFLNNQSHFQSPPLPRVSAMAESVYYSMPDIHSPYNMQAFSPLSQLIPTPPGMIGSPTYGIKSDYWRQQIYEPMSPMSPMSPISSLFSSEQSSSVLQEKHLSYDHDYQRASINMDINNEIYDRSMKINTSYNSHNRGIRECNIVLVKNLPPNIIPIMLFRVFGLYGNVQKVKIFFKNPENALIEYDDHSQALLAKMHLNNCPIFGNHIFVIISKQGIVINTNNLKKGEENDLVADYSECKDHRYKILGSKNYKNIAAPSKVLHLSNLCPDKDEIFYTELFKEYGTIIKFHFLKVEGKMMLMEMVSINDAVSILVHFHNYNIDGKFLKVSFSKYQKIKD